MVKLNEVYKCETCGNIVEVVNIGGGTLVCCGQNMKLMTENTVDAAKEKHVPVVEIKDGKTIVKIGEVPHPMEDAHYIQWVEILFGDRVGRQYLKPGDKPEATFDITPEKFIVREYCNLHGLWSISK